MANAELCVSVFDVVSDDEIERFVASVREIVWQASLASMLRLGRLVVDSFYGGQLGAWRARGRQHPSLRALARRADLPVSVSRLYRCVAIYELADRVDVSNWKHLSPSHVRAVLAVPRETQARLLRSAADEGWTVQRIEAEAARLRGGSPRRGRPPLSEAARQVVNLTRWLDECPDGLEAVDFRSLDLETRKRIRARLRTVRDRCASLETRLSRMGDDFARTS